MPTRKQLLAELKKLGYRPLGQASGKGHMLWLGPNANVAVPEPKADQDGPVDGELMNTETYAQILAAAKGE